MRVETEVALRRWWIAEVQKLTNKVMAEEEKRQAREKAKGAKMLGDLDIEKREDIDELYGYGVITSRQREKLIKIWDKTENTSDLYQEKIRLLQELYQEQKEILRQNG